MNNSTNPLWQSTKDLSKQLNLLNGLIGHLNAQLGNSRERIAKFLVENKLDTSILYSGSRLAITDLNVSAGGYFFFGPKEYMFKAEGDEYYQMVDALIHREAAWTVAHGYESFIAFLHDIAVSYLANNYSSVERSKLKYVDKFNGQVTKIQLSEISYWKDYASFIGYEKVLALLRRIDTKQEIMKIEKDNNRSVDLVEWLKIANLVRNATVHGFAVIPAAKMKNWPKKKLATLNNFFPGEYKEEVYNLGLTVKSAQESLQMFGEYAYIIFRSLSRLHGYEYEFADNEINLP